MPLGVNSCQSPRMIVGAVCKNEKETAVLIYANWQTGPTEGVDRGQAGLLVYRLENWYFLRAPG